jgi:hypothetical protein
MTITLFAYPAASAAKTLVWNASSGSVDGYIVYWGTSAKDRSNSRDVGANMQYNLDSLPLSEGVTYYLCVSAYNKAGRSAPCAPVVYTPGDNTPPSPPIGLSTE